MSVSVVIRAKDASQHLRESIASVRRFAADAEVIVVDNMSTDDTTAVAAQLADEVISVPGAVIECRRPGVELASGELVFFLDADQRLIDGTVADACRVADRHEAVVVPERPLVLVGPWFRTLAAERMWAEASGLGLPRLFWRKMYLSYEHPPGILFGDDRVISAQVESVGLSTVPVLHDELTGPAKLLRKYYRYGLRHTGARNAVVTPTAALRAHLASVPQLPVRSAVWLGPVMALKAGKAAAFYLGAARSALGSHQEATV